MISVDKNSYKAMSNVCQNYYDMIFINITIPSLILIYLFR